MKKPKVLLLDDDEALRTTLGENLEADGYQIVTAASADELFRQLRAATVDTILLDLVLPDADGLSLINKIREHTQVPVIVVSGKGAMVDKVVGLEMGADDYIAKPFEMRELSARIRANIRRYKNDAEVFGVDRKRGDGEAMKIKFRPLILDRAQLQVFDEQGKSLDLTVKEFRLLEALVLSPNRVLSREQLLDKAREDSLEIFDRVVDVQITRFRKKLGNGTGGREFIKTVRNAGYMFVAETEILE